MKKLLLILLLALLMLPVAMRAQGLVDYQFSTGTDATKWIPLTTTTSLITNSAGSTSATWGDSKASTVQNIGFDFTFAGTTYTQFSVNSDGNLRFGSTVTGTGAYSTPFSASNANTNSPKINMLGCDGLISDSGHIYQEVVGTEPNRICVVEFALSTYNTTSRPAVLKWQVQLYEGSNDIQIVFDGTAPSILPNVARQPGMCVNSSEILLINADHTINYYEAGVSTANIAIGNWPDVNRYYLFTIPEDLCLRPGNLAVSNITETTATIAWTGDGSELSWDVYISDQNVAPDESTVPTATVTTPSYDVSGLLGNTKYYVFVRANCSSSSYSTWKSINFLTACPDYMPIPYVQNFDSYTGSTSGTTANIGQACWSQICTGTSSTYAGYPIIYNTTSYAQSGTNCLRFYSYYTAGTYGDEYAIMPPIDVTSTPMNTLQVEFSASKYSTYSLTLVVGVMNDSATVSSFEPIETIVIPTTATAYEYETHIVSFENYVGTGNRIAFKAPQPASSYNSGYLDDIIVSLIPNCKKPMEVDVLGITSESAEISWSPRGSESAWDVVVVEHGSSVETGIIETAYDSTYQVSGLTDNTSYDVYVRANCGGGETSDWSNVVSFATRCLPNSTFPYTENFDTYGTTSSVSFPSCWSRMTNNTGVTTYPYISGTYNHDGALGALYFYSTSSYYALATTELMDLSSLTPGTMKLDFNVLKTSAAYGRLDVGYMTDPGDLSTFVVLKSIYSDDYANTATWYNQAVILPDVVYTQSVAFAFLSPVNSAATYVYLDGVTINEIPDCSAPENLAVTTISGTSAILEWDPARYGEHDYVLEYSEAGMNDWTSAIVEGTTYTLTGLTSGTQYEVMLYSDCSESDTLTVAFTTRAYVECTQPGPTVEVTPGTAITEYYVPVNNYYKYSYTQQIFTADEIDTNHTPTTITGISFQYSYSTAMTLKTNVKIYLAPRTTSTFASTTDWTPISAATLVYEGNLNCHQGWNTFTFDNPYVYNGTDNLVLIIDDNSNGQNGTAYVFNGHTPGSSTNYISMYYYNDTNNPDPQNPPTATGRYASRANTRFLTCDQTSPLTCVAPVITNVEADYESITVDWLPGLNETNWEMEYKSANEMNWTTVGSVTAPYTLSELTSNLNYSIRIRTVCGSEEYSDWATINQRTSCTFATIPYAENFNSAPGSGAANFVDCWTRHTNYTTTNYPYTSSTQKYGESGYSLYFYGTSTYYSYAATPRFDDDVVMDSLVIQFQAYKTSAAYFIQVGVMDDPDDYSSFTLLGQFTPSATSTWELGEIRTEDYTGNGRYLAFRVPASISNYMYVDEVSVYYIPNCLHVEDIHVVDGTLTADGATIAWTAGADETEWDIVYGLAGTITDPDEETPSTVSAPSVVLEDLTDNTSYDVFVRANCGYDVSNWMSFTFRTACVAVSTLPYVDDFDSYGTGTTVYPDCWRKINTYSIDRPYINTTSYSAPGAMYFYAGTAGTYNIAIMPPMSENIQVNTLVASFMYKGSSATDRLIVGVMTDPTLASTFVPVDTVLPESTASTWGSREVSFASYSGTGKYIAFKNAYTTTYGYGYMDNLVVEVPPTCPRPSSISAQSTSSDSVIVNWIDAEGDLWDIIYGPTGFDPATSEESVTVTGLTDTTYAVTGLASGVIYDFYVRRDCGSGDVSPWIITPATAAPYTFEFGISGTDTITACGLTITDDGGADGDYSNNCHYALTINPSDPDSLLVISGTFAGESTVDYLSIYNGTEVNDNNLIQKIYSTMNGGASGSTVEFGPLTAEAGSMTVLFHSDQSVVKSGFVAAVNCVAAPSCRKPYGVAVQEAGPNDVTLEWETMSESYSGFNIVVSTEEVFDPDTCTTLFNSSVPEVQINNLEPNHLYYAMVQTDCGGGDVSAWSDVYAFRSDCEAIAQLPFAENFDNVPGTTTGTTNNLPACWNHLAGTYSTYAGYPIVYNGSSYAASGNNSLRFYTNSTTANDFGDQYAILPTIDATLNPINTLQISFKARKYSTSYASFTLYVGVMSNPTNRSTFVPVDTIVITEMNYADYTVFFNNYQGNGNHIALMAPKQSPVTYNSGYVDNIVIDLMPACPNPMYLTGSNITTSSVDLAWDETGSATAWNIEYGPSGFVQGTGTIEPATTNPYTITGLNAATNYDFYVQADCGMGETSTWSNVFTARTECQGLDSLPFTENFDNVPGTTSTTATVNNLPSCWNHLSGTYSSYAGYPIVYSGSTYAASGSNSVRFYSYNGATDYGDQYAILPGIDDAIFPINTLQLTFDARKYSTSYATFTLYVGVMTDASNAATFVPVDTVLVTDMTYDTYTVYFTNYTGNGNRIAIMSPQFTSVTYNAGYVDNIVLDEIPSCPKPQDPTASNATTSSIDLSWTEMGSATSWNIEYGPAGFTQGAGTTVNVTTNPYTLTGLSSSTNYDFYVQSNCGTGDLSAWSNVVTAATECNVLTLPYTENFDTYTGTAFNVAGVAPICWMTTTTSTAYPAPHITGSGSYWYPHTQPNAMTFTGSNPGSDAYAVLPAFSNALNTIQLAFAYKMESASYGTMTVGYVTDVDNISTSFTVVATLSNTTTITLDTVNFATVPAGTTGRLAFHWNYVGTSYYSAGIDDISVFSDVTPPTPTCDVPTNVAHNGVTHNSANITWTAGGSETAWNLQYRAQGGTWTPVNNLTATTYAMTGLTAQTTYEVQVQAVCDAQTSSEWTASHTFTTTAAPVDPCNAPTNLQVAGVTANSAVVTWTAGGNETSWEVQYKAQSASQWQQATVQTTTHTIEGLTEETAYEVKVRAICSAENMSDFISTTFTTSGTGIDNVTLSNSINLMPNPADNYVELTINSNISVKEAAVYNAFGQLIKMVQLNDNHARIDLSNMASGMYFVRIANDNTMATKKFIKK